MARRLNVSHVLEALDQLDEVAVAVRRGEESAPTLMLRLAFTLIELFGSEP